MRWFIALLKTLSSIFKMESKNIQQPASVTIPISVPPVTVPPVTVPPVTVPPVTVPPVDVFPEALPFILAKEGGYTNHPADKGGPTNKGVIQREYDVYRKEKNQVLQSVQSISDDEVSDIYRNKYWNVGKCPVLPRRLAIVHFDTAINCGVYQAAKFLQRAIKCPADGIVGPKTIAALNELLKTTDEVDIIHQYLNQRSEFYYGLVEKDPSQRVFIKGWQNRLHDLAAFIQIENDPIV